MVVGARQSFQFLKQTAWFLESNRALPKCLYGILQSTLIESTYFVSLKMKSDVNTLLKENLLNIQKDTGVNLK